MTRDYVIWSIEHQAWWAPGRMGYAATLDGAGRYTRAEVDAIVADANLVSFEECAIPITAVVQVSPVEEMARDILREPAFREAMRELIRVAFNKALTQLSEPAPKP